MTVTQFELLRLLVVEDNAPMMKLLLYVLESLNIRNIVSCTSGEEAFREYRNGEFDIVITDWRMEPMSGLDLTRKIRKSALSPNKMVPIILVTSYSSQENVQNARDAGVTEFLVKPFTASDIAKRITHVLEHPRKFVSTPEFFGPDRRRKDRLTAHYNGKLRREEDELNPADIDFS